MFCFVCEENQASIQENHVCAKINGYAYLKSVRTGTRLSCGKFFRFRLLEHFQFEMLYVSNHTACRFVEKTRFFRSLLAGRRCAAALRFTFSKLKPSRVSAFLKAKRFKVAIMMLAVENFFNFSANGKKHERTP